MANSRFPLAGNVRTGSSEEFRKLAPAVIVRRIMNATTQVAFSVIIFGALFGEPVGEDSLRSMLWWRVTVANDVQFYDGMSNTSLTRVCSADHSSILAASPMLKNETYAAHLRNTAGQAWFTLCIAVWLIVVSTELGKI